MIQFDEEERNPADQDDQDEKLFAISDEDEPEFDSPDKTDALQDDDIQPDQPATLAVKTGSGITKWLKLIPALLTFVLVVLDALGYTGRLTEMLLILQRGITLLSGQ